MTLRVGFDARWFNDSGVGTYVAGLLRALAHMQAAENIELVVYESTPALSGKDLHVETRHAASPPQSSSKHGKSPSPFEGLNVERVAVKAPKYSVSEQFEFARRCRLDQLDVFHTPFYVMPFASGCPVVITIHDLIPFLFPIYSASKGLVIKTAYRLAAKASAHIVTVSDNTARDVHKLLGVSTEKITAVPNAADASRYTPAEIANEAALLRDKFGVIGPYVMAASARNWRHKNLGSALAAIDLAGKELIGNEPAGGAKFQTLVYGPSDGLNAATAALGGTQRCQGIGLRHIGYTTADDLAILFRHARAFLMPSLYEGFGLPVLEAMSCGCPVITSSGGSLPEIAGDGAQVFAPKDITGMAAALTTLLTSDDDFAHWRAAALQQAARFSWERTAREMIDVYRKVCEAR